MLSTSGPAFIPAALSCRHDNSRFLHDKSVKTCKGHRFSHGSATGKIAKGVFFTSLSLERDDRRQVTVRNSAGPGNRLPSSDPSPGPWKVWVVGVILSAVLTFWKKNWRRFLQIERQVEEVVERAEEIAGRVEDAAEEVEKVAEELPESWELRDEATFVENVAKETAKDARLVQQVFDKVEEVESVVDRATKEAPPDENKD